MRAARSVLASQQIGMGGVTVLDSQSREGSLLASALTRARWPRSEDWLDLFELIVGLCVPLALPLTAQKSSDRREELSRWKGKPSRTRTCGGTPCCSISLLIVGDADMAGYPAEADTAVRFKPFRLSLALRHNGELAKLCFEILKGT